jgi:hypothetical protein
MMIDDSGRFMPSVWDAGEELDDATRKLVEDNVRAALIEYIGTGYLTFSYRKGGSPIVSFSIDSDAGFSCSFRRDLGDLLFAQIQDDDPYVLYALFAEMFEVYERWRKKRTEDDPGSNIPIPRLVDHEPEDRESDVEESE